MKNNNVKQIGNFVISYRDKKEVAISWKGVFSGIATQMLTNEKVSGILTRTNTGCDLYFDGRIYPGLIFRIPFFMSRNKLERILVNIH